MKGCCLKVPTWLPDGHLGQNPHGPYRAEPDGTQLHAQLVPSRESCVLVRRVGLVRVELQTIRAHPASDVVDTRRQLQLEVTNGCRWTGDENKRAEHRTLWNAAHFSLHWPSLTFIYHCTSRTCTVNSSLQC